MSSRRSGRQRSAVCYREVADDGAHASGSDDDFAESPIEAKKKQKDASKGSASKLQQSAKKDATKKRADRQAKEDEQFQKDLARAMKESLKKPQKPAEDAVIVLDGDDDEDDDFKTNKPVKRVKFEDGKGRAEKKADVEISSPEQSDDGDDGELSSAPQNRLVDGDIQMSGIVPFTPDDAEAGKRPSSMAEDFAAANKTGTQQNHIRKRKARVVESEGEDEEQEQGSSGEESADVDVSEESEPESPSDASEDSDYDDRPAKKKKPAAKAKPAPKAQATTKAAPTRGRPRKDTAAIADDTAAKTRTAQPPIAPAVASKAPPVRASAAAAEHAPAPAPAPASAAAAVKQRPAAVSAPAATKAAAAVSTAPSSSSSVAPAARPAPVTRPAPTYSIPSTGKIVPNTGGGKVKPLGGGAVPRVGLSRNIKRKPLHPAVARPVD